MVNSGKMYEFAKNDDEEFLAPLQRYEIRFSTSKPKRKFILTCRTSLRLEEMSEKVVKTILQEFIDRTFETPFKVREVFLRRKPLIFHFFIEGPLMKMCARCKRVLDESSFNSFRGDKLQSYCIDCSKRYNSEHRAREKVKREKERLAVRRRLLMR